MKLKKTNAYEQLNAFQDILDLEPEKPAAKFVTEKEQISAVFKFFDQRLNSTFSEICKSLVEFLEKAYRIKVKKLVAKFMTD